MALVRPTPLECFNDFTAHLHGILAATLPTRVPLRVTYGPSKTAVAIGFAKPGVAALTTGLAGQPKVYCGVHQTLVAAGTLGGFKLETHSYRYTLSWSADPRVQAFLRWEYEKKFKSPPYARNHVHIATGSVPGPGGGLLMIGNLHLPTGWTLIEDVLRFLLTDFQVKPATPRWHDTLEASREDFFKKFSQRSSPPPRKP